MYGKYLGTLKMKFNESDSQILKELFEETLDQILKEKESELKLTEKEVNSFKKAYSFLFALVYGPKWYTDPDELAQKVDNVITEATGGERLFS